jgi:hypothetical protein
MLTASSRVGYRAAILRLDEERQTLGWNALRIEEAYLAKGRAGEKIHDGSFTGKLCRSPTSNRTRLPVLQPLNSKVLPGLAVPLTLRA